MQPDRVGDRWPWRLLSASSKKRFIGAGDRIADMQSARPDRARCVVAG